MCLVPKSLERKLKDGRASLQALNSEKKQLLDDADDLMARKAALEVSLSDLDTRVQEEASTKVLQLRDALLLHASTLLFLSPTLCRRNL